MRYKKLLLFVLTAFLFFTVWSQQTYQGIISGIVKDAKTKLPITDAVITLSSNAFKGQKFAVTNTEGIYKINNLAPGKYIISYEMEGYEKLVCDSLTLKDGKSVELDYEMVKVRKQVARNPK